MEEIQTNAQKPKESKSGGRGRIAVLWVMSVVLAAAAAVLLTHMFTWKAATKKYRDEDGHMFFALRQEMEIIREHGFYYKDDEQMLTDAALKGTLQAIAEATGDNYATYYTEAEYAELKKQNERVFTGIGILTRINDGGDVEILEVYQDTPAAEAGLLPGDIIKEINGKAFGGETLGEFLANLHAEDGAENAFVILRGEDTLNFTIIARVVHTPAVSYRMLTDTIGCVHILSFHGSCVEETKQAIQTLRESGMKELVLDLRDNLGGSLDDAIKIADIFLPKNYIVTTLRSRTGSVKEYKTQNSGMDIKTVLLVNELSASASELLAGAMKDYDAAYLIGTRTYGKGIVQSFYEVEETKGWLKLTTDAYYSPNGVCVQDEGITPDLIVALPEEADRYEIDRIPAELDTQIQAAIAYLEGK